MKGDSWDNNQGFGDSYYYAAITFTGQAGATATPTPTRTPISPTKTPTPTATTQAPSNSISGRVTAGGAGAAGVNLQLIACSGGNCTVVANQATSGGGFYNFSSLVPPGAGEYYIVRFLNNGNGNFLTYWLTPAIPTLPAGNVNFDIADVRLSSPPDGWTADLPINFSWLGRGIGSDRFAWATSFVGTEQCSVNPPVNSTNFTLDVSAANACGLFPFVTYDWYVYVTNGPSFNNGVGVSAFSRSYTPTGAQGARDRRLLNPPDLNLQRRRQTALRACPPVSPPNSSPLCRRNCRKTPGALHCGYELIANRSVRFPQCDAPDRTERDTY